QSWAVKAQRETRVPIGPCTLGVAASACQGAVYARHDGGGDLSGLQIWPAPVAAVVFVGPRQNQRDRQWTPAAALVRPGLQETIASAGARCSTRWPAVGARFAFFHGHQYSLRRNASPVNCRSRPPSSGCQAIEFR